MTSTNVVTLLMGIFVTVLYAVLSALAIHAVYLGHAWVVLIFPTIIGGLVVVFWIATIKEMKQSRTTTFGWNTYGLSGGRKLQNRAQDVEDLTADEIVQATRYKEEGK